MRCSIGVTIAALSLAFACETRAAERDFAPFLAALSSGEYVEEILEQFSEDELHVTQFVEGLNRIVSDPDVPEKSRALAMGILCHQPRGPLREGTITALKCAVLDAGTTDRLRSNAVQGLSILSVTHRNAGLALLEIASERRADEDSRRLAFMFASSRRSVAPECEREIVRVLRGEPSVEVKLNALTALEGLYFAECLGNQIEAGVPVNQLRLEPPRDQRLLWRLTLIAAMVRLNPYQPAEVREGAHSALFHLSMFSQMTGERVVD